MSACDLPTLQATARANKFTCLDPKTQVAVLLQLLCELKEKGGTGKCCLPDADLVIDNIPLDPGFGITSAHGFGAMPKLVIGKIKVVTDFPGLSFTAGQEFDLPCLFDLGDHQHRCSVGSDTVNVYFGISNGLGNWGLPTMISPTAGTSTVTGTIVGKVYAWK